jgi:hypothetical protein
MINKIIAEKIEKYIFNLTEKALLSNSSFMDSIFIISSSNLEDKLVKIS